MSVFFPYSPSDVLQYLSDLFSINIGSLTAYEELCLTLLSNLYFFLYWFIIVYFALKIFNRIYERLF